MSTAAARRIDPDERAHDIDPRSDMANLMLDLIEANIATAIAAGVEPQLRARIARMLPVPAQAPQKAVDAERNLRLAKVLQALDPGRKRLTEAEFARLNEARGILKQEIGIDA